MKRIFRLKADNFTPITRTPWGGFEISRRFKEQILPNEELQIGESWEVSCDPAFPSMLTNAEMTLQQFIDTNPKEILGKIPFADRKPTCEILVKLLNAASPLSLQIHPEDQDPDLLPNECGKPESWYILEAEQGAGIYLGFNERLSHDKIAAILKTAEAKNILQFVPVKSGDYFEIAPGVPHAIGAGVTLLEPQRTLKGKSGKTFRLWDWDRRYNKEGVEDPAGKPRALHIEEAIKLIDINEVYGEKFVQSLRRSPEIERVAPETERHRFPFNPYYGLEIYKSKSVGKFEVNQPDTFFLILPLESGIKIGDEEFLKGEPIFVAAGQEKFEIEVKNAGRTALIFPKI